MYPIYFKDRMIGYGNNIPGWVSIGELSWLHAMAQMMNSIVEIGSWRGRSTDALLGGCLGTVWAVDHFRGNKEHTKEEKRDIQKEFLKNVGHYENLKLLKMDSLEAAKRFKNKSIDMVFIDGGHEYEEVKADIEAWLPRAKKLICGHDCYDEGVKRAVCEILGSVNIFDLIWIKPIKEAL